MLGVPALGEPGRDRMRNPSGLASPLIWELPERPSRSVDAAWPTQPQSSNKSVGKCRNWWKTVGGAANPRGVSAALTVLDGAQVVTPVLAYAKEMKSSEWIKAQPAFLGAQGKTVFDPDFDIDERPAAAVQHFCF